MFFERSTIGSIVPLMADALDSCGVDPADLFRRAGLAPERSGEEGARVPVGVMRRVWELAYEATGDACFGLQVARRVRPGHLHALGLAWIASSSVGDALRRLERYHGMLSTVLEVRLDVQRDCSTLKILPFEKVDASLAADASLTASSPWPALATDGLCGTVVSLCRQLAGEDFDPQRVELRRVDPRTAGHRDYFRAPVAFSSDTDAIWFRRSALEARVPAGNRQLAAEIDGIVERYLRSMQAPPAVSQVRSILVALLPSGEVNKQTVARRMNASVSTLQRRLRGEGTSFRSVLDETRKELALRYLRDATYSLVEIAFLLGFADQAGMSRAFKRWTGSSPGSWRGV